MNARILAVAFLLPAVLLASCGVKGPPLPPVAASAEFSDPGAAPSPTPSPSQAR